MSSDLLQHKRLIEEYLRYAPVHLSAYAFVSLFAWKDFFEFDFQIIDDNLCIFAAHNGGTFLYLPPLGKAVGPATIAACFDVMHQRNRGPGVSRIDNVDDHFLPLFPDVKFSIYLKGYEYCYYRKDLVALKGNAYKSKRSSCNHFMKNYPFSCEPYSNEMSKDCLELYDTWARQRQVVHPDPVAVQMLEENRIVQALIFQHYAELGLLGRVVYVDGKLKGYTFGYPLNKNTFCIFSEVTDLDIKGLAVYIFREFCADPELADFKFINVMDDFALKNIEQTKLSFRPSLLLPAYTATRKS